MDKQRYGTRQKVTEANLNQLQDYAEAGVEAVAADIVVGGGVVKGMEITPASSFTVSVAAGRARDVTGARASLLAGVTLDLVAHKPSAGQERWATIMAYRTRQQSDPKVDPSGATYYFQLTENTQLQVLTGATAATGAATRPARPGDGGVLIADVLLKGSSASIAAGDISTSRREIYTPVANLPAGQITFTPAGGSGFAGGTDTVQESLDDLDGRVRNHTHTAFQVGALPTSGGTLTGGITVPNMLGYGGKTTGGSAYYMLYLDNSNKINVGSTILPVRVVSNAAPVWYNGTVEYTLWQSNNFDPTTKLDKAGGSISGFVTFDNNTGVRGKKTDGTALNILYVDANNIVQVGNTGQALRFYTSTDPIIRRGSTDYTAWHSGNFDPATKMGTGGGTFTGTVDFAYNRNRISNFDAGGYWWVRYGTDDTDLVFGIKRNGANNHTIVAQGSTAIQTSVGMCTNWGRVNVLPSAGVNTGDECYLNGFGKYVYTSEGWKNLTKYA